MFSINVSNHSFTQRHCNHRMIVSSNMATIETALQAFNIFIFFRFVNRFVFTHMNDLTEEEK